MRLPSPTAALLTAALSAAATAPAGATPPEAAGADVGISPPENYCIGGIDDRKIIVDESQIENPFRQTTRLGCEVDGGQPRTMPDLPTPSPERIRLV